MDNAQLVSEMRRLLSTEAPKVTVADPEQLLTFAGQLSAQFKVRLMLAMGFSPQRARHQITCTSIQGSGLICDCVRPPTVFLPPDDVLVFQKETREERMAETAARNAREEEDEEDAQNEFEPDSVL